MEKSADYWKKRFSAVENIEHEAGLSAYREIEAQYQQAQKAVSDKLAIWYERLARNNDISLQEAKKLLSRGELREFKWDVNDYIRYGRKNAVSQQWMKELENASARAHISRLEAIKLQMQQQVEVLFGNQLDTVDQAMRDVYEDGYYRTVYEIQKGAGVGTTFAELDTRKIDKVINRPWAQDGSDFSNRIWNNKAALVQQLNTTLTQNIIRGEDPQRAIDAIAKRMDVSKTAAGRLVMTEEAAFSSAAQKDCFKELGVSEYEVVVTLDDATCDECSSMDGMVFKMSDYEPGSTAPPFHCYCRCTTIPHIDDDFGDVGERAARDANGKTYYVPADMTYKEWKQKYVGNPDIQVFDVGGNVQRNRQLVFDFNDPLMITRRGESVVSHKVQDSRYEVYVSEQSGLKAQGLDNIEKELDIAIKELGITKDSSFPKVLVLGKKEMNAGNAAAYNYVENTLVINDIAGNKKKLIEFQKDYGYASPESPESSVKHELIHWQDAQEYKKQHGPITRKTNGEYLQYRDRRAKIKLEEAGYINPEELLQISRYAYSEYKHHHYDEAYTELRTLGRRKH